MKKIIKWSIGLFCLLILVIGTLLVLPFIIDLNKFKPQIQELVAQNVQAKIDFSSARLTILSGLGFELKDVRIENNDKVFAGTNLLKVESLRFKAEIMPLLHKELLGTIEITDPKIQIIQAQVLPKNTLNNIASLVIPTGKEKPKTPASKPAKVTEQQTSTLPLTKVQIKTLSIKNASFSYTDMAGQNQKKVTKLDHINLLAHINLGQDPLKNSSFDGLLSFPQTNINFDISLNSNVVTIKQLTANLFSGKVTLKGVTDLRKMSSAGQVAVEGFLGADQIKIEELIRFIHPKPEPNIIAGNLNFNVNFNTKGTTSNTAGLVQSLNANGDYALSNGVLYTKSLISLAAEQFNKFIANTAVGPFKLKTEDLRQIKLIADAEKGAEKERKIQDLKGKFIIKNGTLFLKDEITNEYGKINYDTAIGINNQSLRGTASYTASQKIREQLLSQSKYTSLMFDNGNLVLNLTLNGTVTSPQVALDTTPLHTRLMKNSTEKIKEEVKSRVEKEIKTNPHIKKLKDDVNNFLEKNGIHF